MSKESETRATVAKVSEYLRLGLHEVIAAGAEIGGGWKDIRADLANHGEVQDATIDRLVAHTAELDAEIGDMFGRDGGEGSSASPTDPADGGSVRED